MNRLPPRLRESFFVGALGLCALGGYWIAAARAAGGPRMVPMLRAEARIETRAASSLPKFCRAGLISRSGPGLNGIQPAGIISAGGGGLLLVGSASGRVFRAGPLGRGAAPATGFTGLHHPSSALGRYGSIYVADGTTVTRYSRSGVRLGAIQTDLAVTSFDVLRAGGLLLSAYVRDEPSVPWAFWAMPNGVVRQEFGPHPAGAAELGQGASIASDGLSGVLVADSHLDKIEIYTFDGDHTVAEPIPVPGAARVAALADQPGLVHVGHGEVALPDFAVGAMWSAPDYDVLVEYPAPLLFQLSSDGRMEGCYVGPRLARGVRLRGLFAAPGRALYTIGSRASGDSRIYQLTLPRVK